MELNQETLAELVATKMAGDYDFKEVVGESLRSMAEKAIDAEIKAGAAAIFKDACDAAFANWRDIKLPRTNQWGEPQGAPVSLLSWCEDQIIVKSQQGYGGKSQLAESAQKVVRDMVERTVSDLLKANKSAIEELVSKMLADKLLKR